jgi:mannose-6-phosphate isomerase-like protein (cupin superfamily)
MSIFRKTPYHHKQVSSCIILILCSSLAMPFIVLGQKNTPDSVTFYSHSDVDSLLKSNISPERVARLLGRSNDNEPYLVIIRTKPGNVEIHEQYDDVAIIRSGHGILKTGHDVTGQKESGQEPSREWLGGVIQDGKERSLSPGDFIVIPAMLGHQYIPHTGDSLTYWTIKVKSSKVVKR